MKNQKVVEMMPEISVSRQSQLTQLNLRQGTAESDANSSDWTRW
jgi:hypothetical protein